MRSAFRRSTISTVHLAELIDQLSAALKDCLRQRYHPGQTGRTGPLRRFHFATEERLMEQHQVEDLVRHREEHRRLLHDIRNLHVDGDLGASA